MLITLYCTLKESAFSLQAQTKIIMETTVCKHCGHFEFYYQKTVMANGNSHNGQYCQNCGRWQKWVSQSKNKDPYEAIFYKGKYKDQKILDVCKSDPSYCKWIYENKEDMRINWIKEQHITALELGLEL